MELHAGKAEIGAEEYLSWGQIVLSAQTNPLEIDTVLLTLFGVVDYDTLPGCRLVSQKWKELSDSTFIKRSAFVSSSQNTDIAKLDSNFPLDISTIFKSIQLKSICFSAFKFDLDSLTNPIVREMYFDPYKLTMTQLEISNATQCNSDLSTISNFIFDDLINPNLVKLKLESRKDQIFTISLDKLISLREIELHFCKIVINTDLKMAPKDLKLKDCVLLYIGQNSLFKQMSQLIDFTKVENLYLCNVCNDPIYFVPRWDGEGGSLLNLNWTDCKNAKNLTLIYMIINLDGCISPEELELQGNRYEFNEQGLPKVLLNDYLGSTNMKKIKLDDRAITLDFGAKVEIGKVQISEYTSVGKMNPEANIKKLKLIRYAKLISGNDIVDLSLLPKTIEYLGLTDYFPNLKQLVLNGCGNSLWRFYACPSLVDVEWEKCYNNKKFYLDILPPTVKRLTVHDIFDVEIVGTQIVKLDVLVLPLCYNYRLRKIISDSNFAFLEKIQADLIIFDGTPRKYKEVTYFFDNDVAKIVGCKNPFGSVAIGPVKWESGQEFQDSVLLPLVDHKSDYYLFEGANGTGISKIEFLKLIPFCQK